MKIALRNKEGQYVAADISFGTSSMMFTDNIYRATLTNEINFDWTKYYPSEAFTYLKQIAGPSMSCQNFVHQYADVVEVIKIKFEVLE